MDGGDRVMRFNSVRGYMDSMGSDSWSVERIVELVIRIALFTVFIWAVVTLVKYVVTYMETHSCIERIEPIEIIKLRLARGEITNNEFEKLKKDLK